MDFRIVSLSDRPDLKDDMAEWFHEKWFIPKEEYLKSMEACLRNKGAVPQWYAVYDGARIVCGAGVIENDFHPRKDLSPNVCAVFTEEDMRGKGLAGMLLDHISEDMKRHGIGTLYLVTDHIGFYERYGWVFYCMVQGDIDEEPSRIYVHHA